MPKGSKWWENMIPVVKHGLLAVYWLWIITPGCLA